MSIQVSDRVADLNILNPDYEPTSTWARRFPLLVGALRRSGASIFILQECDSTRAGMLADALGCEYETSHINTILWDPTLWKVAETEITKLPGIQERTVICLKLASRVVAGAYVWAAGSHLSVATSNPKFKNKVSEAEAQANRDLQYPALMAALNKHNQIVLGYDSNDKNGHPKLIPWDHATTEGTDELAVKDPPDGRCRIDRLDRVSSNGGSDHKWILVGDFTAWNGKAAA